MSRTLIAAVIIVSVLSPVGALAQTTPPITEYEVIEIGTGGASGINNRGWVLGGGGDLGEAWVWTFHDGQIALRSFFFGREVRARDLNDHGEFVWDSFIGKLPEGYVVTTRKSNGVCPVRVTDISQSGLAVGTCQEQGVVVWDRTGSVVSRVPGHGSPLINSAGTVVGEYTIIEGESGDRITRVFIRGGGIPLQDLPDGFGPIDINDHGVVLGNMRGGGAALWTAAAGLRLINEVGRARAINNHSVVLGSFGGIGNVVWTELGGITALPGLTALGDINDLGWIVGSSGDRAVLWIPRGTPRLIESDPPNGWIDPRDETGGIDRVTLVFNHPVFNTDGSPLGLEAFSVETTGNRFAPGAPPVPAVASVDVSANPTVVVTLSRPIPVGEWTTIRAHVASAEGFIGFGAVRLGHLPCDIDGSGDVTVSDVSAFGVEWRKIPQPKELLDIDRSAVMSASDVSAFSLIWRGAGGASRAWAGQTLPTKPRL